MEDRRGTASPWIAMRSGSFVGKGIDTTIALAPYAPTSLRASSANAVER